jgi:RHS repeat-associated protein
MLDTEKKEGTGQKASPDKSAFSAPAISLPKGGGAIRGLGEKFGANPVTGTGSLSVPIANSPGRSGFGPQLSLSYDSGAGNGPFGFGWSLSLPSITRKSDKGLPRYQEADESDVFILSGSEDLVPALVDNLGQWVAETGVRVVQGASYRIQHYRPRVEGQFARIERWTNEAAPSDTFWRSITHDNITTFYGRTDESRISDPADPRRIFSWLICESDDDKGNAIIYEYAREDSANVDLSQAHEKNRTTKSRSANRYLKRIKYGNKTSRLVEPDLSAATWLFEMVFDYGEGHFQALPLDAELRQFVLASKQTNQDWPARQDAFSSHRAGYEVRTYRLCRSVLMFHHFPNELGTDDYLVRSTEFAYDEGRVASFITSVTQSGYVRVDDGSYLKKSLPPLEFEYTKATVQDEVVEIEAESQENLPVGLDGIQYQWLDLDGEGLPGILSEEGGAWFYKPNLGDGHFGSLQTLAALPSARNDTGQRHQFLDLAGDGQLDVVQFGGPVSGFYERTDEGGWQPFTTFSSLPHIEWDDPNLRFVDLTGDGHADILITEDNALTWLPSLGEEGFSSFERFRQALDEERGPKLVFADGTQSIYLADMCGDGLADLVRVRNGEVCYWPNLGYGHFGAKVTMDRAPRFDNPDQFDQRRMRLADIDGSGTTDIIYLGRDQVSLHFNQSGNSWSEPHRLSQFPLVDSLSSVMAVDLLGNGTACLVWSSPLPRDARRPMRYVDLMGGQKPHLLTRSVNNLGAETRITYAPSTKFYIADKLAGKPWITRIPFPVHLVERVETYDRISGNRFVTRYVYHHGYFDGVEREFRGFGMVEQLDTEEFAALSESQAFPSGTNVEVSSHVPPVLTRTWFHTGVYLDRNHLSDFFAGLLDGTDAGEYYREPGLSDAQARDLLLDDTMLPDGLTVEEEREACRALKGSMLRQEVYALDGTARESHPYTVTEQNFTIQRVQPRASNRYGVFFTHAREAINYHYERDPADPRISHALTLEVDAFGNALKEVSIGYGRRQPDPDLPLQADRDKQTTTLITYTENQVTNVINDSINDPDNYRTPLPSATRTYELTGFTPAGNAKRFSFNEWVKDNFALLKSAFEIAYEATADVTRKQKRPIEQARTLYRKNDLTALLPLSTIESLALTGESYKLAFTPGLLTHVYQRPRAGQPPEALVPNPANLLGGTGVDRGGYVDLDGDNHWWISTGRIFYSPDISDSATQEQAHAHQHFFLPRRYRDAFEQTATVTYDAYDLLMAETRDPLGNRVTVGERDSGGNIDPNQPGNNYRVLQPRLVSDPNRNRTEITFDALGMVVGTAVKGKDDSEGDTLSGFEQNITQARLDAFYDVADPHSSAPTLLKNATTRMVYDLDRFRRTRQAHPDDPTQWLPTYAATIARETHVSDPLPPQGLRTQISFSYSDGFGREIQKKVQAEPGPLIAGGPVVSPRWVGSGWTIFNNKGKPVRQYEPFFSQLPDKRHRFEFGVQVGVSPIFFYDPVERVVATLYPNHTYEKAIFGSWRQATYDVNDTVAANATETGDPRTDPDIKGYVAEYFKNQPGTWETWHQQRITGAKGVQEQSAAQKAAKHANTPATEHFDNLGRPFLTLAHNGFKPDGTPIEFPTRTTLDIEGNQREVRDAIEQNNDPQGRIVMRYDYDMLGTHIHRFSMEAGQGWMLNDVTGKPIRAWDSRGHTFRTEYDPLRRPLRSFVTGANPTEPDKEVLTERLVYGEQHPDDELRNLRGKLYLQMDQAGVATTEANDFKGNLLRVTRRLAREYREAVGWSTVDTVLPASATTQFNAAALNAALTPLLEADTFTSRTSYDALNRAIQVIAPRSDQPGAKRNILQPVYNEANFLERVHVWLDHPSEPAGLLDAAIVPPSRTGVNNIDYDAKGRRLRIEYKNGATTRYAYDPETFRLTHLYTRRGATFNEDCENPQPPPPTIAAPDAPPASPCGLQNLHYTYDPAGNLTHIRDDAQQTIYFRNKRVEPSNDYAYDAIYRLVEATGREHLGQVGGTPIPHSHNDVPRIGIAWSANDGKAMGVYTESYAYDAVSNILSMKHEGKDPAQPGWTRSYTFNETSLIEDGTSGTLLKTNNRLSSTTVGSNNPITEQYVHDSHGNMIRMPHLGGTHPVPNLHWNYKDQLHQVDLSGGGTAYYVYDSFGQRARKILEKAQGGIEERIYLDGFEVFRRHNGAGDVTLERETLHVMDDKQRIALVETRTLDAAGDDPSPAQLIRYQFGNHLGSASLELDDQAQIISYEEYSPYGSTLYQAVRSQTETPKRYRYTGKERDDESGLYYHGARYCAPWLGRWTACDPAGLEDSIDLYAYARCNPLSLYDPTGTLSVDFFKKWLSDQIADKKKTLTTQKTKLGELNKSKTDLEAKVKTDEGTVKGLDTKRTTLLADRKKLESLKSLKKDEKAKLKSLKQQNTKLVNEMNKLRSGIEQAKTDINKLDDQIKLQTSRIAVTQSSVDRLSKLQSGLTTAYANATKTHKPEEIGILTDVIMNEARGYSTLHKKAIAYAYINYHLGVAEPPLDKFEISGYKSGGTEALFGSKHEKDDPEGFIQSLIDSLDVASARLDDPKNASDPTKGATKWVTPKVLRQMGKPETPSWAKSLPKHDVPGIDPDDFTFWSGLDKKHR